MEYRAVAYFTASQGQDQPTLITMMASEGCPTRQQADSLLGDLLLVPANSPNHGGFTDGRIEALVPGYGWCNVEDVDNVLHKMSDHSWEGR